MGAAKSEAGMPCFGAIFSVTVSPHSYLPPPLKKNDPTCNVAQARQQAGAAPPRPPPPLQYPLSHASSRGGVEGHGPPMGAEQLATQNWTKETLDRGAGGASHKSGLSWPEFGPKSLHHMQFLVRGETTILATNNAMDLPPNGGSSSPPLSIF